MSLPPIALLVLAAPVFGGARAQEPRADDARQTVDRILRESLARGEAWSRLQSLCAATPHRLTGSPDAENAVAWARAEMEKDGLENVRLEDVTVPVWRRGHLAELAVVEPAAATTTFLPILALGGSSGTAEGGIEGELIEVQGIDELKTLGPRVQGRIVLFARPMDPSILDPFEAYDRAVDQRSRGPAEAARLGAIAAIVRSMSLRLDDHPHTGATRFDDGAPRIPAVAVSTAGAERLGALLRAKSKVRLHLKLDCKTEADALSHNVVGEIRGTTRPTEIVLIGAHLDGWDVGQGAHDDGAGCAQVLEAMRLLRTLAPKPERTIRAVLFMNEENGLRGALAYREAHRSELASHVFALESDRGGFAPRGFTTNADAAGMAKLAPLVGLLSAAGAGELLPGGGGADVSPLARDGVPVLELVNDPQRYFDVHHSSRDTLDTVHPREIGLGAGAIAALAWLVAGSPERFSIVAPR